MSRLILSKDRIRDAAKLYLIFTVMGGLAFSASLFAGISLCVIYNVTGIPSPSCGMTRAFMSLPDVRLAFFYHPLFFTVPFIPFAALFSDRLRNITSLVLIVLFLSVWALRLFYLFPHTPPMNYNENSLFELILFIARNLYI